MGVLAQQISAAVRTATNPDAAAVEISAAHRAARADIDAAEAERDQAISQAREAARTAQQAQERTELAEVAAEEALAELERAEHARDEAIGERDELAVSEAQLREERDTAHAHAQSVQAEWDRTSQRLEATTGELTAARGQIETLRDQLATVRQEAADLAVARTELTAQLTEQRHAVETQRRRAETAEHDATRSACRRLSTSRAAEPVDFYGSSSKHSPTWWPPALPCTGTTALPPSVATGAEVVASRAYAWASSTRALEARPGCLSTTVRVSWAMATRRASRASMAAGTSRTLTIVGGWPDSAEISTGVMS
jgi:hypothetical protein